VLTVKEAKISYLYVDDLKILALISRIYFGSSMYELWIWVSV